MKYGLIGEKLGHSYSVPIHKAFGTEDFVLCPVAKDKLDEFMRARDFLGINVTIPYKKAVMPYCDEIDEHAVAIGCVNTLVVGDDGKLRGYNTDFSGFELMAQTAGIEFEGKKVVILGTGGTSLTATAVAKHHGAREIVHVSRSGEVNYENVYTLCADADIIVNTTPVGMYPLCGEAPVELSRFAKLCGVLDVVYNPRRTALMLEAERLGIPHGDGLLMLVQQAKLADEMYQRRSIPDSDTFRVCAEVSRSIENIVLIGMPGCGKSSIGALLAEKLGREIADTDDYIVEHAGMSIPDIFEKYGEAHFRSLEREAVRELGAKSGLVIATGGGAPKDERNHAPLRQNGRVYHINRDVASLATDGRPLSTSQEALVKMQVEREPFYAALRDVRVENSGTIESAAEIILEDFLSR